MPLIFDEKLFLQKIKKSVFFIWRINMETQRCFILKGTVCVCCSIQTV